MDKTEIDNYIDRMIEHKTRQLQLLEQAIQTRYEERPVWDPLKQDYFFVSLSGRERKRAQK